MADGEGRVGCLPGTMTGSIPMCGNMQDLHGGNDDASRAMTEEDDVDRNILQPFDSLSVWPSGYC